jgi:Trk K+ transport system NAD-binding subunit/nucleotide-binding universal stress UspA family protein
MGQNFCRLTSGEQLNLLIIGGGDIGIEMARRLCEGWHLTIVDRDTAHVEARLTELNLHESVRLVEGDATSRLVLEEAGAGAMEMVVVVTPRDRITLEICRVLNRDFAHTRVWALLRQAESAAEFDHLDVQYVHDFEAVSGSLVGRITRGSRIAGDVGLGKGEIMETEILPNSSVIGKKLSLLSPQRWLIAAIYRNDDLVVPHGDTTLEAQDRVLLVGDPRILPCIAAFLRTGHSEFPLHYGTGIGVLAATGREEMTPELEYMLQTSRAEFIQYLDPDPESIDLDKLRSAFMLDTIPLKRAKLEDATENSLARQFSALDLGLIATTPPETNWLERTGARPSRFLSRLTKVGLPVLVSRLTHPYKQIMLAISDADLNLEAAILAIDVARMLTAELTITATFPPEFVSGSGFSHSLENAMDSALALAKSYGVPATPIKLSGNPSRAVLAIADKFDLIVTGWKSTAKHQFLRPSVEASLVAQAPVSVMVLPR